MPPALPVDSLWERYQASRAEADRNLLVEHYLNLVEQVATKMWPELAFVEYEDLVAWGTFGLIDAVTRFDPSIEDERGRTRFSVFAWTRIRGAIFDELRLYDQIGRTLRDVDRRLVNTETELTRRLQRTPTKQEIADEMGVTIDALDEMRARVAQHPLSIENAVTRSSPNIAPGSEPPPILGFLAAVDDTVGEYEVTELRALVVAAWNALPARERTVLTLRYREGLTLEDASQILGVAKSWVSNVTTEAIRMLRTELAVQ